MGRGGCNCCGDWVTTCKMTESMEETLWTYNYGVDTSDIAILDESIYLLPRLDYVSKGSRLNSKLSQADESEFRHNSNIVRQYNMKFFSSKEMRKTGNYVSEWPAIKRINEDGKYLSKSLYAPYMYGKNNDTGINVESQIDNIGFRGYQSKNNRMSSLLSDYWNRCSIVFSDSTTGLDKIKAKYLKSHDNPDDTNESTRFPLLPVLYTNLDTIAPLSRTGYVTRDSDIYMGYGGNYGGYWGGYDIYLYNEVLVDYYNSHINTPYYWWNGFYLKDGEDGFLGGYWGYWGTTGWAGYHLGWGWGYYGAYGNYFGWGSGWNYNFYYGWGSYGGWGSGWGWGGNWNLWMYGRTFNYSPPIQGVGYSLSSRLNGFLNKSLSNRLTILSDDKYTYCQAPDARSSESNSYISDIKFEDTKITFTATFYILIENLLGGIFAGPIGSETFPDENTDVNALGYTWNLSNFASLKPRPPLFWKVSSLSGTPSLKFNLGVKLNNEENNCNGFIEFTSGGYINNTDFNQYGMFTGMDIISHTIDTGAIGGSTPVKISCQLSVDVKDFSNPIEFIDLVDSISLHMYGDYDVVFDVQRQIINNRAWDSWNGFYGYTNGYNLSDYVSTGVTDNVAVRVNYYTCIGSVFLEADDLGGRKDSLSLSVLNLIYPDTYVNLATVALTSLLTRLSRPTIIEYDFTNNTDTKIRVDEIINGSSLKDDIVATSSLPYYNLLEQLDTGPPYSTVTLTPDEYLSVFHNAYLDSDGNARLRSQNFTQAQQTADNLELYNIIGLSTDPVGISVQLGGLSDYFDVDNPLYDNASRRGFIGNQYSYIRHHSRYVHEHLRPSYSGGVTTWETVSGYYYAYGGWSDYYYGAFLDTLGIPTSNIGLEVISIDNNADNIIVNAEVATHRFNIYNQINLTGRNYSNWVEDGGPVDVKFIVKRTITSDPSGAFPHHSGVNYVGGVYGSDGTVLLHYHLNSPASGDRYPWDNGSGGIIPGHFSYISNWLQIDNQVTYDGEPCSFYPSGTEVTYHHIMQRYKLEDIDIEYFVGKRAEPLETYCDNYQFRYDRSSSTVDYAKIELKQKLSDNSYGDLNYDHFSSVSAGRVANGNNLINCQTSDGYTHILKSSEYFNSICEDIMYYCNLESTKGIAVESYPNTVSTWESGLVNPRTGETGMYVENLFYNANNPNAYRISIPVDSDAAGDSIVATVRNGVIVDGQVWLNYNGVDLRNLYYNYGYAYGFSGFFGLGTFSGDIYDLYASGYSFPMFQPLIGISEGDAGEDISLIDMSTEPDIVLQDSIINNFNNFNTIDDNGTVTYSQYIPRATCLEVDGTDVYIGAITSSNRVAIYTGITNVLTTYALTLVLKDGVLIADVNRYNDWLIELNMGQPFSTKECLWLIPDFSRETIENDSTATVKVHIQNEHFELGLFDTADDIKGKVQALGYREISVFGGPIIDYAVCIAGFDSTKFTDFIDGIRTNDSVARSINDTNTRGGDTSEPFTYNDISRVTHNIGPALSIPSCSEYALRRHVIKWLEDNGLSSGEAADDEDLLTTSGGYASYRKHHDTETRISSSNFFTLEDGFIQPTFIWDKNAHANFDTFIPTSGIIYDIRDAASVDLETLANPSALFSKGWFAKVENSTTGFKSKQATVYKISNGSYVSGVLYGYSPYYEDRGTSGVARRLDDRSTDASIIEKNVYYNGKVQNIKANMEGLNKFIYMTGNTVNFDAIEPEHARSYSQYYHDVALTKMADEQRKSNETTKQYNGSQRMVDSMYNLTPPDSGDTMVKNYYIKNTQR